MDSVDEATFILNPNNWPVWPFLPLKHWDQETRTRKLGLIIHLNQEGKTGLWWYPDQELYRHDLNAYHEFLDEKAVRNLVEEGWKVD